jgi:hypothetical protein
MFDVLHRLILRAHSRGCAPRPYSIDARAWTSLVHLSQARKRILEIVGEGCGNGTGGNRGNGGRQRRDDRGPFMALSPFRHAIYRGVPLTRARAGFQPGSPGFCLGFSRRRAVTRGAEARYEKPRERGCGRIAMRCLRRPPSMAGLKRERAMNGPQG